MCCRWDRAADIAIGCYKNKLVAKKIHFHIIERKVIILRWMSGCRSRALPSENTGWGGELEGHFLRSARRARIASRGPLKQVSELLFVVVLILEELSRRVKTGGVSSQSGSYVCVREGDKGGDDGKQVGSTDNIDDGEDDPEDDLAGEDA